MKRTSLPSREELLKFIRERSGNVGTREIARAFGAKNADRAALKHMLRELTEGGHIERHRKRLHRPGTLPPVVLADITGRDSDGGRNGMKRRMARLRSFTSPPRAAPGREKSPASAIVRCSASSGPATAKRAGASSS
jgi:hypothetical protein